MGEEAIGKAPPVRTPPVCVHGPTSPRIGETAGEQTTLHAASPAAGPVPATGLGDRARSVDGRLLEGVAHPAHRTGASRSARRATLLLMGGDVLALLLAFFLAWAGWIASGLSPYAVVPARWTPTSDVRLLLYLVLVALVLTCFWHLGHYTRRQPLWDELRDISKVVLIVGTVDAALVFLGKWQFSRGWLVITWCLALVFLPLFRMGIKRAMIALGGWVQPTVIVGTGRPARDAAAALISETLLGFDVVAFLAPPGAASSGEDGLDLGGRRVPVLRMGDRPGAFFEELGRPHLVVALESDELVRHQSLLERFSASFDSLRVVPPLSGIPLYGAEISHFLPHELLMLRVRNNLARLGPRAVKRALDIVGASLLLVGFAPFFAYVARQIRRTRVSAIYGHRRIGCHGRPFTCYKFRTMVPNADQVLGKLLASDPDARAEWERNHKLKNDPRVTKIGAFLRRTSLDELPQLWNVLKGDMSLVGPRPIVEQELAYYGDQLAYYLEVRPGITGLWQVSGRNDVAYDRRVFLDSWYVKNWSAWYDLMILFKTLRVVFNDKGAY